MALNIVHYQPHPGGFMFQWQEIHFLNELRQAGHQVRSLNPMKDLGRKGSAEEYSDLGLKALRRIQSEGRVDLFICTSGDLAITSDAIKSIKTMGIPTLRMSFDDFAAPFRGKKTASAYDLVWTTVPENEALLQSYGATTVVLPFAANPVTFAPPPPEDAVQEWAGVGFIGSAYGARAKHVSTLASAAIPVKVYGRSPEAVYGKGVAANPAVRAGKAFLQNWNFVTESLVFPSGRSCLNASLKRAILGLARQESAAGSGENMPEFLKGPSFQDFSKTINGVALSLGSTELASTFVLKKPLHFVRLREFEVPMSGGIHLVNRSNEILRHFEEDKHILCYSSDEELIDKARFYSSPKALNFRIAMRQSARQYSLEHHTWNHRFLVIFRLLNLNPN